MSLRNLSRWQWTTVVTLTVGYAGYYFCRSNFSVATPLLLDEFGDAGVTKESIGDIAGVAIFFYAGGKLINGILSDFVGGRRMFLFGMLGSICATVLFGIGTGFGVFMVAWCANRFIQSMGWGALVKTASRWFPASLMGTILGILCLSYLFGDVVARLFLGQLVTMGLGWRAVFFAAAVVLGVIFIISIYTLKTSPMDVGEIEPEAHKRNLFGDSGNRAQPKDLWDLLTPFFTSYSFWLVCCMNFGLTIIRETFNLWTPTYLTEAVGMTAGGAAKASSVFPLFGGISVLVSGFLSDRLTGGRRGAVIVMFLVPSVVALFSLAFLSNPSNNWLPLTLIAGIGFLTLGPYAFLSGVISVDLGGKRGSSTAAGLADTVGYAGGIISTMGIGRIAERWGWSSSFLFLGTVLAVTTAVAVLYWYLHELRGEKHAATPGA